ncbi:MAG: hypothetical protein E7168_01415 [Firmicutes bacterium]|nr:hypothetical protein [Bacillota bacterium]
MNITDSKKQGIYLGIFALITIAMGVFFKFSLHPLLDAGLFGKSAQELLIYFIALIPLISWNYNNTPLPFKSTIVFTLLYFIGITLFLPILLQENLFQYSFEAIQASLTETIKNLFNFETLIALFMTYLLQSCIHEVTWTTMREIDSDSSILFTIIFSLIFLMGLGILLYNPIIFIGILVSIFCFKGTYKNQARTTLDVTFGQTISIFSITTVIYVINVIRNYLNLKEFYDLMEKSFNDVLLQKEHLINIVSLALLFAIPNIISQIITKMGLLRSEYLRHHKWICFLLYLAIYIITLLLIIYIVPKTPLKEYIDIIL